MKLYFWTFLLAAAVVMMECKHTFMGSNIGRRMVYNHRAQYGDKGTAVQNLYYAVPYKTGHIQGILAYDRTNSGATANVTQGGIGFDFVNLSMKSDRRSGIDFDVYIYA